MLRDKLGTYTMGNFFQAYRHEKTFTVYIAGKKYKYSVLDIMRMRNSFSSINFMAYMLNNPGVDLYLDFVFNNKKKIQLSMTECISLQDQLNNMQLPLVAINFPDKTVFLK